jgi:hypothetical protein
MSEGNYCYDGNILYFFGENKEEEGQWHLHW